MTPEAQRIAIAEACGWVCDKSGGWSEWTHPTLPTQNTPNGLPDHLNDLNAVQSAVCSQGAGFQARFSVQMDKCSRVRGKNFHQMTAQDWADCFINSLQSERASGN